MIMAEFSIIPVGKGESISRYVARAVEIVRESGLKHQLTPMGTVIEGNWEEVFSVIRNAFHAVLEECPRVTCSIKIDCRKNGATRMEQKIASVEEKLIQTIEV
jgi:uncharacterized protein (TIGR00106 family)